MNLFPNPHDECLSICYFPAIYCPSLEQLNAHLNTTERTYGTSVSILCYYGFRLDEITGSRQETVRCLDNEEWDSYNTICKGKQNIKQCVMGLSDL